MSKGGGSQNSVTEPWSTARPYLHEALQGAQYGYQNPAPYFPGASFVGPTPGEMQAWNTKLGYSDQVFGGGTAPNFGDATGVLSRALNQGFGPAGTVGMGSSFGGMAPQQFGGSQAPYYGNTGFTGQLSGSPQFGISPTQGQASSGGGYDQFAAQQRAANPGINDEVIRSRFESTAAGGALQATGSQDPRFLYNSQGQVIGNSPNAIFTSGAGAPSTSSEAELQRRNQQQMIGQQPQDIPGRQQSNQQQMAQYQSFAGGQQSQGLDARAAINSALSGQPDYSGIDQMAGAANAPLLRQFEQDILPGLNSRATFLNNPTGGIKTLNRVLPDLGQRMSENAMNLYNQERMRAMSSRDQAAGLVSGMGQNASQQALGALGQFGNIANIGSIPGELSGQFAQYGRGFQDQALQDQMGRYNYYAGLPQQNASWYTGQVAPLGGLGSATTGNVGGGSPIAGAIGGGMAGYGMGALAGAANPWLWAGLGGLAGVLG